MKQIVIRLDTGPSIGLGHLMRCLSLAERLTEEHLASVSFLCRNRLPQEIPYEVRYLKQGAIALAEGYQVSGIEDEVEEMKQVLRDCHIDCLIVDHYGAGDGYFEALREHVSCLVCIDDGMKRTIPADIVVNGNLYGAKADYGAVPVQLLGGTYTLLRKEFQNLPVRNIRSRMQTVYLTSGGSDPLQFCEKILQAAGGHFPELSFHVIAGSDFEPEYTAALEKYTAVVHKNADMRECMLDADLFITGGGSTLYELAATGTPSISYILAEDQRRVAEEMWKRDCSVRGGCFAEFQEEKLFAAIEGLKEPGLRQNMSRAGQKTVRGQGAKQAAKRIMEVVNAKSDLCGLYLIPADESHMELLLEWANEEENRKFAFQTEPVSPDRHKQWFYEKLCSDKTCISICRYGKEPVGQVRIDIHGKVGEIDYFIAPEYRNRGYAKQMLRLQEEALREQTGIMTLLAKVKYPNVPSQKVFEKLGYEKQEQKAFLEYRKALIR